MLIVDCWQWFIAAAAWGLVLRLALGYHGHSGLGRPPMHGDFEAQRHWVEITTSLPPQEWYRNGTHNDLNYWGLDYPPLSAWHAKLIPVVAKPVMTLAQGNAATDNQLTEAFELTTSRGNEALSTRTIMRVAAIMTDIFGYMIPCAWLVYELACLAKLRGRSARRATADDLIALFLLLTPPAQSWIDHGHFQFNSLALGLAVATVTAMVRAERCAPGAGWVWDGVMCFCAASSIMFKQMELYFSLAFAACLLHRAVIALRVHNNRAALRTVLVGGCSGVGVIAACLAPPLRAGDVLHRMFPFARGLYEDKVANVWCALSPVLKLNVLIPDRTVLIRLCAFCTFAAALPACLGLVTAASRGMSAFPLRFSLTLAASSLAFFLFSYQVHEKGIMMPATALVVTAAVSREFVSSPQASRRFLHAAALFNLAAHFSMAPLASKDRLTWAYAAVFVALACLVVWTSHNHNTGAASAVNLIGLLTMCGVHVMDALYVPDERFPDLVPLLYSAVSCGMFVFALVWITRSVLVR